MTERVYTLFQQSVAAKMQVGEALVPSIEQAAGQLVQAFLNDKKVLICGNGPSAALATLFTNYLIGGCEKERPSLPAIDLSNSTASVHALTQSGDVLIAVSCDDNSKSLVQAAQTAGKRGAHLIALTGRDGGQLGGCVNEHQGTEIRASISSLTQIHEIHLLIIHCLCDLIDHRLFGID